MNGIAGPGIRGGGRRRDADVSSGGSGSSNNGRTASESPFTGALDEFRIHCPNCSHQFTLSEGLMMEEERLQQLGPDASSEGAAADTAHGSMESLVVDDGGTPTLGNETLLKVATDGSCVPDPAAGGADPAANGDDSRSCQQPVSRCYQILNWTIEDLERVICDPNDRRIRKISSISQCDIEVRSEMAPTKFGAPKNFCILRASQAVSIDQCRSLLKRQLLWVMKPRAQETDSPPAAR